MTYYACVVRMLFTPSCWPHLLWIFR